MIILNKKNLKFKLILLIILFILLPIGESKAVLQANPNTHYKQTDNHANFMNNIRKMEENNGTMGLKETFNADLTPSSGSNGIDVHMEKSTEYGAVAILSASGYGNPNIIQNSEIKTTTGNKSGVYFSGSNWENVAGCLNKDLGNVNEKYYNSYSSTISSAKIGDALGNASTTNPGCTGWHSSSGAIWVNGRWGSFPNNFYRGGSGLFNYSDQPSLLSQTYINKAYSRGVAVVGEGF